MKALTLTQPWASLVANGSKEYETRSWETMYRGPLAIHAAKSYPKDCRALIEQHAFKWSLRDEVFPLPLGAIIAVVDLVGVRHIDLVFRLHQPKQFEYEFGDYSLGRFAWHIRNVRRLPLPIPCKGALSLWNVPAHIADTISALHLI